MSCPKGKVLREHWQGYGGASNEHTKDNLLDSVCEVVCEAGKYLSDSGSCMDCEIGKYQSQEGADSCTDCADGHYQADRGQTACVFCT